MAGMLGNLWLCISSSYSDWYLVAIILRKNCINLDERC
jgi:hypothetical protein